MLFMPGPFCNVPVSWSTHRQQRKKQRMSKTHNDPITAAMRRDRNPSGQFAEYDTAVESASYAVGGIVPKPENVRGRVLRVAEECVNGDRNAQYGDPNADFTRTASFWNTYLCGVAERKLSGYNTQVEVDRFLDQLSNLISAADVGQMMTLLKISRSCVSPEKEDHYVDAAGYQACAADCAIRS
jgi:hypothetical protein